MAALGTLWLVQAIARDLAGRPAAHVASFIVAAMPTVAYYGKLGNVEAPYLFWVAASLFFFIRAARCGESAALAPLAITATLATCTKDQAFAFYVLPAVALAVPAFRARLLDTDRAGPASAIRTKDLVPAIGLAAAAFAVGHNLPFNWTGFVAHLQLIAGDASAPYRMWPVSPGGQLDMAVEAARQFGWLLGLPVAWLVPVAVVCEARHARRLVAIVLPAVSYYVCFCEVAGYLYDRFLMGPAIFASIVVATFAAGVLDRMRGGRRRAAIALGAACGVYLFSRALSVDLLMLNDSRYAAERWLRDAAGRGAVVAAVGPREALPRYERRPYVPLSAHLEALAHAGPALVVVNADLLRRYGPGRPEHDFRSALLDGTAGYRRALAVSGARGALPLTLERPFRDPEATVYSNLAKIGPSIEIYQRLIR